MYYLATYDNSSIQNGKTKFICGGEGDSGFVIVSDQKFADGYKKIETACSYARKYNLDNFCVLDEDMNPVYPMPIQSLPESELNDNDTGVVKFYKELKKAVMKHPDLLTLKTAGPGKLYVFSWDYNNEVLKTSIVIAFHDDQQSAFGFCSGGAYILLTEANAIATFIALLRIFSSTETRLAQAILNFQP